MKKHFAFHFGSAVLLSLLISPSSFAFLTVQESNDIAAVGKYKLGIEPQIKTSNGNGANFTGFFDAAINEEASVRVHLGTGDTDFYTGGSIKWVPVPDYGKQPAIGGKVGVTYWREQSQNFFTYRFDPLVSKKFESEVGAFTPYASLPMMLTTGDGTTVTGFQLAAGTEYTHPKADNMTFGGEIGLNLKDSFSYISGFVTIYIDEIKPLNKKK